MTAHGTSSGGPPGGSIAQYEIIEKLGSGAMGVVYKALDTRLRRTVALKFLTRGSMPGREAESRFLREARAAAALEHPNICTLYEIVESEGELFLAMAFVDGPSLKERLWSGTLTLGEALSLLSQVAAGLEEAHEHGVVHRDIKPGNILLTKKGAARIVDFGLAQLAEVGDASEITRSGTAVGTPAYMAPEQWQGDTVDHRADIWALGVVLFEMLTRRLPFGAHDQRLLGHAIRFEPAPALASVDPTLPRELDAIVNRCLEKRPDRRYPSSAALRAELEAVRSALAPEDLARSLDQADVLETQVRSAIIVEPPSRARSGSSLSGGDRPSIAVLPFANASPDPDNEYFSDGMTDEIINALTKLRNLRVVARTSVFQFKGKIPDVATVAAKLRVDSLLTGSVRKWGDRLRISVQLISVSDEQEIWSDVYERAEGDVFAIQDEISQAVVEKLKVRLALVGPMARGRPTENMGAYNACLRGRYHWSQRSEESFRKAIECFQASVAADPSYPQPYAGLADCYALLALYGWSPPEATIPLAKAAASKAIELDPLLGEPYISLGLIFCIYDWDWEESSASFERGLELSPGYSTGHHFYAHYFQWKGDYRNAMREIRRAEALDPLSLAIKTNLGWFLVLQRKFKEGIDQLRIVLDLEPNFSRALFYISTAYEREGRMTDAIASAERACELANNRPTELAQLGRVYGLAGRIQDARRVLDQMREIATTRYVAPVEYAVVYACMGENDEAFTWLEKGRTERSLSLLFLDVDPRYDRLRDDARFAPFLATLGKL